MHKRGTSIHRIFLRAGNRESNSKRRDKNRPIRQAACAVAEMLESRTLLTALPTSVHASADAAYSITGSPGDYTLSLTAGSWTLDADISSAGSDWQNLTLDVSSGIGVTFNSPQTLAGLSIAGTATVAVSHGSGGAPGNYIDLGAGGLSIASGATLDLGDNDMILQNAGTAGVSQIQSLLASGYNSGAWTGTGIDSSAAGASSGILSLGFALNSTLATPFTTFDGVSVSGNDVLVKYTVAGDATLDGRVNGTDYTILTNNYGDSGTTWVPGDFNYDGNTDAADDSLLSANFGVRLTNPSLTRTLQPVGVTITPPEGADYSGLVATFMDTVGVSASPPPTAADYNAYIDWGDGVFISATVTGTASPGIFTISGTSPSPLSNPDAVISAMVEYATGGTPTTSRPASLSEPIQIVPAVSDLSATAASSSEIDLAWTLNATNASAMNIFRSEDGTTFTQVGTTSSGSATAFADTGLSADTQYYYKVCAVQPGGSSAYTNTADTYTLLTAPTGQSVTAGDTEAFLYWTGYTGADSYNIYRSSGGAYVNIGSATTPEYTDFGVANGTAYSYEISAVNAGGESALSSGVGVTPASTDIDNLMATGVGTNEIDLSWELNTIGAENIEVDRSPDGSTWTTVTSTLPGTTLSYADTGVSENTQYYYRVRAIYPDTTTSAYTNVADAYSLSAITDLSASPASATEIDLSWTTNITNATAIEVDASPDGTTWTTLTSTLNPTATTYAHTDLSENTHYYYRVHAITSGSTSEEPAYADTTTLAAVDSLSGTAASPTEIDLTWNVNVSDATATEVDRSADGGSTWTTLTTTLDPATTTYADTSLADNTDYIYRVRVIRPGGESAYTDPADAVTVADVSDLTATPSIFGGAIDLAWTLNATGITTLSIYRATDGGAYSLLTDSISTTAISYTDSTVAENHDYSYQLQPTFSGGVGNFSDPAGASSAPIQDIVPVPDASTTGVTLNWSNYSPYATSIEVDYSTDDTTFTALTTTLDGASSTYDATGLTANSEYYFRLKITDGAGTTTSGVVDTWTLPAAPTGLTSTSATPTEVDLSWTNNAPSTTPVFIERSDDGGADYAIIDEVSGTTASYQDTSVTDGTGYVYLVAAVAGDGYDANPTTSTVSVFAPLAAPTQLTLTQNGPNEIDLSWSNPSQTATGYVVQRSTDGTDFSDVGDIAYADDSFFSDTGLSAGTQYYYRVKATDASSDLSSPTAIATTVTAPGLSLSSDNASTVYEGSTYTLTTNNVFPSGEVDPIKGWIVNWGDGNTTNASGLANGDPGSFTHVYTTTGFYTITASTIDGSFSGTQNVEAEYDYGSVDDRIAVTSSSSGMSSSVSATYTDPAGHHVTNWIVSWGDGTIQSYSSSDSSTDGSDSDPTSTDTKAFTHTYPDSPNYNYQISITAVTDENVYESGTSITTSSDTSWSSDTMTVGTTSSDTSLYPTPIDGVADAEAVSIYAPPGNFSVNWGDGSDPTTFYGSSDVNDSPAHQYNAAGTYIVTVTETPDGGGTLTGHAFMPVAAGTPAMPTIENQVLAAGAALGITEAAAAASGDPLFATINFDNGTAPRVVNVSSGVIDLTSVDAPANLVGAQVTDGVTTTVDAYSAAAQGCMGQATFTSDCATGSLDVLTDDGSPLGSTAKQTTGGFLAVNDGDNGYQFDSAGNPIPDDQQTGINPYENDLLPLVLRAASFEVGGRYTLTWTSPDIKVWMNEDKSPGVDADGSSVSEVVSGVTQFSASTDTTVFVEGIAQSPSLGYEKIAMNWYPTGGIVPLQFDFVRLTVDKLSGPQDVPSYARYTYSASGPFLLGTWAAAGGAVQSGHQPPFRSGASILWNGSDPADPTAGWVGKALYSPAPGFTLERDVNVVQVTFGTTVLHMATQGKPIQLTDPNNPALLDSTIASSNNRDHVGIFFDGNNNNVWDQNPDALQVIARGPIDASGTQRGLRFIQLGWVQQAKVVAKNANYTIGGQNVEVRSATQDGQIHWDTFDKNARGAQPEFPWNTSEGDRYIRISRIWETLGGLSKEMPWTDEPQLAGAEYPAKFPWAARGNVYPERMNIVFENFTYFDVGTTEVPDSQTIRISASWTFNGSGKVAANSVWTPDANAGITIVKQPLLVTNGDVLGAALPYVPDLWGANETWITK